MSFEFNLPKIETRSKLGDKPEYIIRGYATVPNNVYAYKKEKGKVFKEYFSDNAIDNIKKKIKNEKIFVDVEHALSTKQSSEIILNKLKEKTGINFDEEVNYISDRLKYSDIPMFKVSDISIDDKGLYVEIKGNPYYRTMDDEHKNYFDSIWGSIENGYINGMSLNFKPIATVQVNENLTQIDDIDIYGISLTGGASNDMATITEVAMRSIEYVRGEKKCQKRTTSLMML